MKLLSQTTVARQLGRSAAHVRKLDAELRPIRVEGGGRVYLADVVARVARRRKFRRGAR